jgi:hypothetical protein
MNTEPTAPSPTRVRLRINVEVRDRFVEALTEWNRKVTLMTDHQIRRYGSFEECTKKYEQQQLCGIYNFCMFTIDRPTTVHGSLKYTKEYCLVGYSNFFNILQALDHGLDEVLHPTRVCRLFMETKVEKVKWDHLNDNVCLRVGVRGVSFIDVLDKAMEAAVRNHKPYTSITEPQSGMRRPVLKGREPRPQTHVPASPRFLLLVRRGLCRKLVQQYIPKSRLEWTEEVCQKGCDILVAHIKETLGALFVGVANVQVRLLSSSSEESFALRIICPLLYCDSPCSSMPLVVHEIARRFAMANLRWLFDYLSRDTFDGEDAEYLFRLRALRLEAMASPAHLRTIYGNEKFDIRDVEELADHHDTRAEGCESMYFHCVNDTPFNESVYDLGHTIPAPMPRFVAETEASGRMINSGNTMVPPTMASWVSFLVGTQPNCLEEEPVLICDLVPSTAYARTGYWNAIRQTLRHTLVGTHDVVGYVMAPLHRPSVYLEERPCVSVHERREKESFLRYDFVSEYHPVGAYAGVVDDSTLSETSDVTMENGEKKSFGDCKPGELVFCCNLERPSGCVFEGGIWCSECRKSTVVPGMSPWEEPYLFLPQEIVCDSSAKQYMPDLDWDTLLGRKYVVVAAPMGSGKTQQICSLLNILDNRYGVTKYSVLVVSFRILLSQQQASRFGILCYTQLSTTQLMQNPPQLTICVNSLGKLGGNAQYDYVILDECGLIRRHFLGRTVGSKAEDLYRRLVKLQKGAKNVIMLQDGITRNDIQFYTEAEGVECDNREHVSGYCFLKPIEIHPLSYTTNHLVAIGNLVECYKSAFDTVRPVGVTDRETGLSGNHSGGSTPESHDGDGGFATCKHPFMVFCSNVEIARVLLGMLRKLAVEIGADPDRIQGVWAAIKKVSPFAKAFAEDPNAAGRLCDVVICSSVIGAGFSVETHFQSFHAFLYTGVLNLDEEKQLIQRLRYQMRSLPNDAIRNSYIYTQNAYGNKYDYRKVLHAFDEARTKAMQDCHRRMRNRLLPAFEEIRVLAETQARVATERAATRSMHDELWQEYGSTLQSRFELLQIDNEAIVVADAYRRLDAARKGRTQTILAWFSRAGTESDQQVADVDTYIEHLEIGNSMDIVVEADVRYAAQTIEDAFGRFKKVAMALVTESDPRKALMFRAGKGLQAFVARSASMITWLMWTYGELVPDAQVAFFKRISTGPYKSSFLTNSSHFIVGTAVFKELFGVKEFERPAYQRKAGRPPFYVGGEVVINQAALDTLMALFHVGVEDTPEEREKKQTLKNALAVYKGGHDRHEVHLRETFGQEKTARVFVKRLLNRIGLDVVAGKGVKRVQDPHDGVKRTPLAVSRFEPAFTYALCLKHRHSLLCLLPALVDNMHTLDCEDITTVQKCIDKFKATCNELHVDHDLLEMAPRRGTILPHVATRETLEEQRVIEGHAQNNEALFLPSSEDVDQGSDAEDELVEAIEAANALIALDETQVHNRQLALLRQIEDPPSSDEEEDDDNGGRAPKRRRCRFIDEEAGEV